MKTYTNTLKMRALQAAKDLAVVTIIGFCAFSVEAAPAAPNLNAKQAQVLANRIYDRTFEACGSESGCLAKHIRQEFKGAGFATRTVLLTRTRNQPSLKIHVGPLDSGETRQFDYHAVTIVRLIGGWRVADPITLQSPKIERFKEWKSRVKTPVEMSVR